MKKRVVSMLAAAMLLLVCAVPVWADTDKEIQFNGHTFGETFSDAARKTWINTVEFERKPKTARGIGDPAYSDSLWGLYSADFQACFFSRVDGQKVAGHDAEVVLHFCFPTSEAAAAYDVQNAVFYGGEYEFHVSNKAVFDDLKQKLSTVYGGPSAEFTNPMDFWGKPAHREDLSDEEAERIYQENLEKYNELFFVVWQQSGTDKLLILVYSYNQDNFERTRLYYFDSSADALIEQLFQQGQGQGAEGVNSNDLSGL